MFNKLKEKLKSWFKKSEEKAEEEEEKEIAEAIKEEVKKVEKEREEKKEKPIEKKEKESIFKRIKSRFKFKISESYFEEIFSELETLLLENNTALEVVDFLREGLKKELVGIEVEKDEVEEKIKEALKISLETILTVPQSNLIKIIKKCKEEKRPCVLLFLGFNGVGKSLSLAKVALYLKKKGFRPILAAGDTWRAAGIAQLEKYAQGINVPVIKHQYGADSCAVIFDTIKAAKAQGYDVVLADTAGRAHTDTNLIQEIKKISKVNKPDLKILVVESLIGNDVVTQTKMFDEAIDIDAIIFTKTDVDEKGGAILSASYIIKKPIMFMCNGQGYDALEEYDAKKVLGNLGL